MHYPKSEHSTKYRHSSQGGGRVERAQYLETMVLRLIAMNV